MDQERRSGAKRRPRREQRVAGIVSIDIKDYSRLMDRDEAATHRRVAVEIDRLRSEIDQFEGRIFSFAGDGLMAEFRDAAVALKCALRLQSLNTRRNRRLPPDLRLQYRMGVNWGPLIVERDQTGGRAVNIAARLESVAHPGGICLSGAAYRAVKDHVPARYIPGGEQRLKGMAEPVTIYHVAPHLPAPDTG